MTEKFYYVTKYALTDGIWKVPASAAEESSGYLYVKLSHGMRCQVVPRDWFTDLESAKKRLEELRLKKLESLRKAIKKMENYLPIVVEKGKNS